MFGFPGYNSVVIGRHLKKDFSLTVNGSNPNKFQQMKPFLHKYLNQTEDIRITGWDPTKFGVAEAHMYDKILLQAPSSDENKTFSNEAQMKKWTNKVISNSK
jgi:hypothetical protein